MIEVSTKTESSTAQKLNRKWSKEQKARFYGELKMLADRRGYKSGWAAWKFKERLSVWPDNYKQAPKREPSPETLAWVRHTMIKRAKSEARA